MNISGVENAVGVTDGCSSGC